MTSDLLDVPATPPTTRTGPWVRRLPSGNPVIDTRAAEAEEVASLRIFDAIEVELASFGPPRNLRVWVLHEAATRWTETVEAARSAARRLHLLSRAADGTWVGDAAVLVGAARDDRRLVYLLRSLAITPYPLRSGGGLPVHEVDFGDGLLAGMTGQPCPGDAPPGPVVRHLNEARDGLCVAAEAARQAAESGEVAARVRLDGIAARLDSLDRTENDFVAEILRRPWS